MTLKKLITVATVCLFATACASTDDQLTASNSNSGKICQYEKTTSSHIKRKICRTKEQIEQEREAGKEALRKMSVDQAQRR